MNTGHTSKAALGAARIALLAGASVAAIFAASSAYAQTPPGLVATDGSTWILENSAGTPIATAGNVDPTGKVITTYGAEGLGYVAVAGDSSATVGGSFAVGSYLVDANGVPLSSLAGCTATTCSWAAPTAVDPNVKFVQNTYANESAALGGIGYKAVAADSAATVGGTFAVGNYVIDSTTGAIRTDLTGCTAATCSWVAPASVDPKPSSNIAGLIGAGNTKTNDPAAVTAFSLGTDGKPANQTTSVAGGVVYSNSLGQYSAIGPDGATFNGAVVTVTNGLPGLLNSSTTINNGTITSNQGGLLVGGSTTISGGNVAINGGLLNSNAGGNVNTLPVAGAALNVSGGAVVNNGLEVNNGLRVTGPAQGAGAQTIDMGGNRVQDVGTPILGTDATNKAYVDKGLNKAYEGTAIALAISQPVFLPGQTFAVRGGWGDYEGQNAFGVSAAGVVAHNVFGYGSTVSLDGGIGAGNSSVAGKAGVTVGFGGGSAPLK